MSEEDPGFVVEVSSCWEVSVFGAFMFNKCSHLFAFEDGRWHPRPVNYPVHPQTSSPVNHEDGVLSEASRCCESEEQHFGVEAEKSGCCLGEEDNRTSFTIKTTA